MDTRLQLALTIAIAILINVFFVGLARCDEPIEIRPPSPRACAGKGAVCLSPGVRTLRLASAPSASATKTTVRPSFQRLDRGDAATWKLEMVATLLRPSYAGNAVFLIYDADDAKAVEAHEVVALFQASVPAATALTARIALGEDDGVRPSHDYRLRIVQLIDGKELLLAEGELTLR